METILDFFLNQGIMGVLLAANILVIVYLFRRLESCKDERIQDQKNFGETIRVLHGEKDKLQREHLDTIVLNQREVDAMIKHLTSTLEALISALARGLEHDG